MIGQYLGHHHKHRQILLHSTKFSNIVKNVSWRSWLNDEVVHTINNLFFNNIQNMFDYIHDWMMKWSTRLEICYWTTSNTCLMIFKVVWWSGSHNKTFVLEQHPAHVWWYLRLYNEVVHKKKHLFLNNIKQIFDACFVW